MAHSRPAGRSHQWIAAHLTDGQWDLDKGGTDRDTDNDGQWDANKGGTDRDLDNDGQWDAD